MQRVIRASVNFSRAFSSFGSANLLDSLTKSVATANKHKIAAVSKEVIGIFDDQSSREAQKNREHILSKCLKEPSSMRLITADLVGHMEYGVLARCIDQDSTFFTRDIAPISLAQIFAKSITDKGVYDIDRIADSILECRASFADEDKNIFDKSLKLIATILLRYGKDLAAISVSERKSAAAINLLALAQIDMNVIGNFVVKQGGKLAAQVKQTPLHAAVLYGEEPLVEALLEGGANPAITDEKGDDSIRSAIMNGATSSMVCKLFNSAVKQKDGGPDWNRISTYFIAAHACGRADILRFLIENPLVNRNGSIKDVLEGALLREDFKAILEVINENPRAGMIGKATAGRVFEDEVRGRA